MWLHVYDDLPPEYTDFRLARDVFHCLPSELEDEPWENVSYALNFIDAEIEAGR